MRQAIGSALRRLACAIDGRFAPVRDISDHYTGWVSFANAGMLERGNLLCFDHAIRHRPSEAAIVEIGSFCGLSTNMLLYYRRRHGARCPVYTCDKWEFEGARPEWNIGDDRIGHGPYRDFVRESFIRNMRFFSGDDLPRTIEMVSDDFFAAWREGRAVHDVFGREFTLGGPIGICYIDGNHTYEFARRDFENADRHLERGGFILFDDSADGSGWEVCRVVKEVAKSGAYEVVMKNPNYLFRKR